MSYCRFSRDSDVYVIRNTSGMWECVACHRTPDVHVQFATKQEIHGHLLEHLFDNDKVPEEALDRLNEEIREERDAILARWTPEEAEALMLDLGQYFGEPVRRVRQYCEAFRTWQRAIEVAAETETDPHTKQSLQAMADDIHRTSLHVSKSNLLARLIYSGEALRTQPCPIHKGHWSGCAMGAGACPHCMSGFNITGWVKGT